MVVAEYNSKFESAALLGRVAGRIAKWQTRATKLASAALEYGVARLPTVTRLRRLCAYLPERCLSRELRRQRARLTAPTRCPSPYRVKLRGPKVAQRPDINGLIELRL